jgi:hypothetical protein
MSAEASVLFSILGRQSVEKWSILCFYVVLVLFNYFSDLMAIPFLEK